MEYRKMGNTGLQLSVLSLGSWVTFAKQIDDYHAETLMTFAYEQGVNFFDNAEVYANGESEMMMGRVLRKKEWDRSSYVLSSKVFFGKNGNNSLPNQMGLGRKHIMEACHEALERMQTPYLDLYFCHRPDPTVPMVEIVRTMNTLIQQGKIFYWGTSEWSAAEILEAHSIANDLGLEGPTMEQPQYNMLHRHKVEVEFNEIYDAYGLGTTIWSPLASGLLTGKYNDGVPEDGRLAMESLAWLRDQNMTAGNMDKVRQICNIAASLNVKPATLAIAWCIANPKVTTAILGATKLEQLEENMKALELYPLLQGSLATEIQDVLGDV